MKLFKQIFFLAIVGLVALGATTALAQEKGRRPGGGGFGATSLSTIAANEDVQKELGISSDVAKKLTSLRDDHRAAVVKDYQTAGISLQNFQNLTAEQRQKMADIAVKLNEEFDPKVKELVGGESPFKRLQQIQLQTNLRFQGPSALTEKSVAAELSLTDDQKQKLNALSAEFGRRQRELQGGGGGEAFTKLREERTTKTMEVLNDGQKEKLKALQGNPFDVSQLGFGGRRGKN